MCILKYEWTPNNVSGTKPLNITHLETFPDGFHPVSTVII